MGPPDSHAYQQTKASLLRNQIPVVPLSRGNFGQHIPNVNLPEGNEALVDVGAGILYADRALKTARVRVQARWPRANANVCIELMRGGVAKSSPVNPHSLMKARMWNRALMCVALANVSAAAAV